LDNTKPVILFLLGVLLGAVAVMLLWLGSSGGGMAVGLGSLGESEIIKESTNDSSGILLSHGPSGATILTTGERGTRSIFIDASGTQRELICYTSVYCIDETPCEEECEEEECVEPGEMCGYWPAESTGSVVANFPQSGGNYYGECCPPDECINGYCTPPEEECVQLGDSCETDNDCCEGTCTNGVCSEEEECLETGEMCGLAQDPNVATHVSMIDYGECCEPDVCVNNFCSPPEECVQLGEVCRTDNDCCEGTCINGICSEGDECNDYGEMCGLAQDPNVVTHVSMIDYGDCCDQYVCLNNICGGTTMDECFQPGEACKLDEECCEGYSCIDYVCGTPCVDMGERCVAGQIGCCEGFCVSGECAECKPGGYTCDSSSDCCEGYECSNGRCSKASTCAEADEDCDSTEDCCEGMMCSDNGVCVECAPAGDYCEGYSGAGLSCCEDSYCIYGMCKEKVDYLCEDTEGYPDYYSLGSATGEYEGVYGTYVDYCQDSRTAVDYYCQMNDEYSPVLMGTITCPNGCSGGACK
jgi:hypothetical protein